MTNTKTFREIIREAANSADLNVRERIKLRMVMRFRPEVLERELFNQAQAEGVLPVTASLDEPVGTIDWEALAAFIKEVLPAILQIISLFL